MLLNKFIKTIVFLLIATHAFFANAITNEFEGDKAQLSLKVAEFNDDGNLNAVLNYEILTDWKIYWREAGDNGFPQEIDYSASENIESIEVLWPYPEKFADKITPDYTSISYGYKNKVAFPLIIKTKDKNKDVKIDLTVNYAICKEVCIPATWVYKTNVPAGYKSDENSAAYLLALDKIPSSNNESLSIDKAYKTPKNLLKIDVSSQNGELKNPQIFIESNNEFAFYNAQYYGNRNEGSFIVLATELTDKKNFEKGIKATLTSNKKSVEKTINNSDFISSTEKKINAIKHTDSQKYSLIIIILFGFLGGLILNIMPCVLPVLSIKLIGIIKHSQSSRRQISLSFLSTAFGIIFSFLALGAIVLIFKNIGMSVGWGFHFQEPIFLIFLILILIAFAANMFGMYEFKLPAFLSNISQKESTNPFIKNFMSGVLATTLATPCTAPFLGTAVGVAVTRGGLEIIYTFLAMGVGMSLPYLIFSVFPSAVNCLPKAGGWMLKVKKILGLMLLATAAWLIWVVSMQISPNENSENFIWQKFDESKISSYLEQDKIIFVDVTADWCLTCKVNKFFVLEDDAIKQALSQPNIIAMQADWTNKNEEIAAYLRKNERAGIPFNIIYSNKNPQGIILSELLTENEVLRALEASK